MIKLIGALCIICAGTLLGFYQALQLSARPRQIRQSLQGLQRLETEILYGFTPLSEAFVSVAGSLTGPVSTLFERAGAKLDNGEAGTVADSWRQAIDTCWANTAMKRTEREALLQLGSILGISDRADQAKHLRLAVSVLQAEEAAAAEDYRRYGSMWRSLGLLSGVLIVILMY
ncbi:MAG: spoIIIAB [Paenibacillaceae bacterium]|jgi:stage III sporulation protein AB|nr:spoIIIAB [Paenibacillaceae bacterium]